MNTDPSGPEPLVTRRYLVRGRVQGVGYRYFVQQKARQLQLFGTVRNLDNGTVEVITHGSEAQHQQLCGYLHRGPEGADVRGVEQSDAPMQKYSSFAIVR